MAINFSVSPKADMIIKSILDKMLYNCEGNIQGLKNELHRYKSEFLYYVDYSYAEHGNLLFNLAEVKDLCARAGYVTSGHTDEYFWRIYRQMTGRAIDIVLSSTKYGKFKSKFEAYINSK